MTYYRVKPRFDNYMIDCKGNFLIANELYTAKELEKKNLIIGMFEQVEIQRNKIVWSFGARFEIGKNYKA